MQYLKEDVNGNRVPVTAETHMVDSQDKNYHQVLATCGVVVYKMSYARGAQGGERPQHYGGRNRASGMPWSGA